MGGVCDSPCPINQLFFWMWQMAWYQYCSSCQSDSLSSQPPFDHHLCFVGDLSSIFLATAPSEWGVASELLEEIKDDCLYSRCGVLVVIRCLWPWPRYTCRDHQTFCSPSTSCKRGWLCLIVEVPVLLWYNIGIYITPVIPLWAGIIVSLVVFLVVAGIRYVLKHHICFRSGVNN